MSEPAISAEELARAEQLQVEVHVPNEMYQVCTLLALQVGLLLDIRFALNELLQYKQSEVHR